MQQAEAVIVSLADQRARVVVERQQACARCAAGRGCGAGIFSEAKDAIELDVDVPDGLAVAPGDRFVLELAPADLLGAAALVYGLPLAGVVLAVTGVHLAAAPVADSTAALAAGAGLVAGFLAGRLRLRQRHCLRRFVPSLAGRVDSA